MNFYMGSNINFSYNKTKILNDISLHVKQGSITSLLGANGQGKSTLLKIMLGILPPNSGEVLLFGQNLQKYTPKQRALHISYVPQHSFITFPFSVLEIVLMGRIASTTWFKQASLEDKELAKEALETLGIFHLKDTNFQTLSGGQKQLTLIARALAQGTKIILMDEPISGLDYGNQIKLLEILLQLQDKGYTIIKSSHFPDHAFLLGGDVYALQNGKIIASGKTKEIITEELIFNLYNAKVKIQTSCENKKICIPFLKQS